jgi:hypothetical protein
MTRTVPNTLSDAEKALLVILSSQWDELRTNDPKALEQAGEALGLNVEVGDTVRSLDFAGDFGCYITGEIVAIEDSPEALERWGCPRYRIRVTHAVRDGEWRSRHDEEVFPPLNGTPASFTGRTFGVWKEDRFECAPPMSY